jgi:hypothetical protein
MEFLKKIEELEDFIFEHEIELLDTFAKGLAEELMSVRFGSESVEIVYLLECGQMVCDQVKIDKFLSWKTEVED